MSRRGRPPAGVQVRRLLVLVPWLVSQGRVRVDDVAARFGITPAQLMKDLGLAMLVGLPPYTPDQLLEFDVSDDGWITAQPPPVFRRPPRLSAGEAVAVLAAGRALLDVVGAEQGGALAHALDKLERVLGGRITVDLDVPPLLDDLRAAVDEGRQVHVEYWSAWRDELTTRDVEPHVVYASGGRWYLDGFDDRSGEVRRFRVDRIRSIADTGERFAPVQAAPPERVFDPGPGAQHVVVRVPPEGRWVVETYPVEYDEERDGWLRVTFTVVGTRWLERVLLRLGPGAEVVSPPEVRDTGREVARRLLANYETG